MSYGINNHRETALDSPYSRDRKQAIESLSELYADVDEADKQTIAETFREITLDSAHRNERELAREELLECGQADPEPIGGIVVETLTELASESKFSDERLDAIDDLRKIYADLGEGRQDEVGKTLAKIAGNSTYDDERKRARRRLSDITRIEREQGGDDADGGEEAIDYLGQSLAEHLKNAGHDSAEASLQRAEELQEFMAEHPVEDDSYEEVRDDVKGLIQAIEALGSDGELTADRIERIERIARRIERLYARA